MDDEEDDAEAFDTFRQNVNVWRGPAESGPAESGPLPVRATESLLNKDDVVALNRLLVFAALN